ncbi:MAG: glycosyltransferase, partial [Verrucomicrobia bacterium]|nr:glycosyltransferase [Deltaproteobacteria bacterium]
MDREDLERALAAFVADLLLKKGLDLTVEPQTELVDSGLLDSLSLVEVYTYALNAIQMEIDFEVNLRELDTIEKICEFLFREDGLSESEISAICFSDFLTSLRGDFNNQSDRSKILEADYRIATMDNVRVSAFVENFAIVANDFNCKYGVIYFWLAFWAAERKEYASALQLLKQASSSQLAFPFSGAHLTHYLDKWSHLARLTVFNSPTKSSTLQEDVHKENHSAFGEPPGKRKNTIPESALAHKWLDGLAGLEIGSSALNPFGLNTRNVGLSFEGYIKEQCELTGEADTIHIVAPADDIPVPDDSEDFVLSSHVIEHCPDMIKALVEWYRVIKPGGYLYMIIPFRDAAPTDKGRPLTEWDHIFKDYVNQITEKEEPEANGIPFGYGHYHVFEINQLHGFVQNIFGDRLELVDHQNQDDKIGNGFTLVYRKNKSFNASFPWSMSDSVRKVEIRHPNSGDQVAIFSDKIVVAANLVPFRDVAQRQRQDACIASVSSLSGKGVIPLNICFPDELLEPAGWQIASVLQRSADVELKIKGKRKPFVTDLFDSAAAWAAGRGIGWFVLTNSDIILTDRLLIEVRRCITEGYETIAVSRNEIERIDPVLGLIPGYLEVNGYDIFVCRTDWWQQNRHRFQSYIYGERAWDDAYAAIMACHSRFTMLYKDGLCFHVKHPTDWISGPYADYNMGIYNGTDKQYSDRYEAFIKEVVCIDKKLLDLARIELLLQKYFTMLGKAELTQCSQPIDTGFVNIGMVTYNRLEFTRQAISALLIHTDYPYALTVIDNNSQDGSKEYLQDLKRQGIIKNLVLLDENVGVAKAANLAWSLEPGADYFLKLDNDIVIQKLGWLTSMIQVIDNIPEVWALGYNFEPQSYPLHEIDGFQIRPKGGTIGGACFLVPRRTHEKLGFWCEDYGLYGEEDFDYGTRIRLSGMYNAYMADEHIGIHLPAGRAATIDEDTYCAKDGIEESCHAGYRLFKDEQRRINMRGGRVQNNFLRYQSSPESMYQPSRFAEQWIAHHANLIDAGAYDVPASFHAMAAKAAHINVAILSLEGPGDACARIRLRAPLDKLGETLSYSWAASVTGQQCSTDLDMIDSADLIVVQRFYPRNGTVPFLERALNSGKPVIYEADDLLFDLPDSNHLKPWAAETAELLETFLPRFSAITVSTPQLKEAFSRFNSNVFVLPNMLDYSLFHPVSNRNDTKITIGFCGTNTHALDLSLIDDAIFRIAQTYGDKVDFLFMGYAGQHHAKLPGFRYVDFELGYQSYAQKLAGLNIDIALIPLEDNPFNRCKSNIKWLEYSACGYAGVYADLAPYNTSVEHGRTGLLVGNNPQQWYEAISLLIENPDLRRSIAANACTEVLARYSVVANAHKWLDAYRTIISNRTAVKGPGKAAPEVHTSKPVSIIIPLFNKSDYTRRCLETLTASTPQHLYELILIDNGSSDGTSELLAGLPSNVKVIRNQVNRGFSKACNQGAQAASGKYLLFLNNDTEPQPGWLEALLNIADQDPAVAAVGSKLLFPDGTIQHAGVVIADDRVTLDPLVGKHIYSGFPADDPSANVVRGYQAMTAACLLVRRDSFAEVDGFDEEYWNGYEDVDLCFKLGQKGWKLIY